MRRLVVLAMLLGVMLGLKTFLDHGELLAAGSPLTLAAIGFVVLAAFTVGELVSALSIPKITGYILSGVVFGPQVSNILSHKIVSDMRVFNTLALGLIALTAGLELDVKATRKVLRTLMATVALKIPLLMISVAGAFWAIETYHPFLGLESRGAILALAIIFAVLGIGTSPSVSLAVINDARAKGRLSDLTLAMAVVKDLVVVVCLAVAIAVGRGFYQPDAQLSVSTFLHVGKELGGSILLGATLGLLLILYVRFVRKEMLLTLVATVLLTAEAAAALYLELLLVLIATGFVVRNFSSFEHALLTPLTRVSLPVFVVFFTTAGAGVDLHGTIKLLPLAAALAAGRALSYYIASAVGTRAGGESEAVRDNAWLAYLPQAGVTLGLVLLTARQLPDLADAITSTGLALVSINLLVGPITLGLALRRAGELPNAAAPGPDHVEPVPSVTTTAPDAAIAADSAADAVLTVQAPARKPDLPADAALEVALVSARQGVQDQLQSFWQAKLLPRTAAAKLAARRAFSELEGEERPSQAILRLLGAEPAPAATAFQSDLDALEQSLVAVLEGYPDTISVPLTPRNFELHAGDLVETKVVKVVGRALSWVRLYPRHRRVPLRLALRYTLEKPVVEVVALLGDASFEMEVGLSEPLWALARGQIDADTCRQRLDQYEQKWWADVKAEIETILDQGMERATFWLDKLGGPGHPASEIRLSEVLPAIAALRRRRVQRLPRWQKLLVAARETVRATAALDVAQADFKATVERRCWAPLALAEDEIMPLIRDVLQRLTLLREPQEERTAEQLLARFEEVLSKRERNRLRGLKSKYRHGAQTSDLLTECSQIVERMPPQLHPVRETLLFSAETDLLELRPETVDLAELVEEVLIDRFVPRFSEALGPHHGDSRRDRRSRGSGPGDGCLRREGDGTAR